MTSLYAERVGKRSGCYERRALKFNWPIRLVCRSANSANAKCENIIKIDLGTINFQQFLATISQHYDMRCSSYTGVADERLTVVVSTVSCTSF